MSSSFAFFDHTNRNRTPEQLCSGPAPLSEIVIDRPPAPRRQESDFNTTNAARPALAQMPARELPADSEERKHPLQPTRPPISFSFDARRCRRGDFASSAIPSLSSTQILGATRPRPPSTESKQTEEKNEARSSFEPPIVNSQAQEMSKRRKKDDFTPKDIFCIVRSYLNRKFSIEAIPDRIARDKPKLPDFILRDHDELVRKVCREASSSPNRHDQSLAPQIAEVLFWLRLNTLEAKGDLIPDVIFSSIRKYIVQGNGPEDIAAMLPIDKPAIMQALLQTPLAELQKQVTAFTPHCRERDFLNDVLPQTLSRLYLTALENSSISTLIKGIEEQDPQARGYYIFDRLALSQPSYWKGIFENLFPLDSPLRISPNRWENVTAVLHSLLSAPLPNDIQSLQDEVTRLRRISCEISVLQSSLSLLEQIPGTRTNQAEQLIQLANGATADQFTLLYPKCKEHLPRLFHQLDICRRTFPVCSFFVDDQMRDGIQARLSKRLLVCQQRLESLQAQNEQDPLNQFFSIFAIPIYEGACAFFSQSASISLLMKEEWPQDLKGAWDRALAAVPIAEKQFTNEEPSENRDRFLYQFWNEYATEATLQEIELQDVFKLMLQSLSKEDFDAVHAELQHLPNNDSRASYLKDVLPELVSVSYSLEAIKNWCLDNRTPNDSMLEMPPLD